MKILSISISFIGAFMALFVGACFLLTDEWVTGMLCIIVAVTGFGGALYCFRQWMFEVFDIVYLMVGRKK